MWSSPDHQISDSSSSDESDFIPESSSSGSDEIGTIENDENIATIKDQSAETSEHSPNMVADEHDVWADVVASTRQHEFRDNEAIDISMVDGEQLPPHNIFIQYFLMI